MASAIVLVVFVLIASAATYSVSARHTNNDDGEGSSRGSPTTQPILRISTISSSPSSSSSSASFVRCWGRHCSRKGRGGATVAEQQIPSSVEGRRRWRKGGASAARPGRKVAAAATTAAPLAAEDELSAHWCDLWVSRGAGEASLLRQVNRTDAMFLVADATWVPEAPLPVEWQRRYNRHPDQQRQSTDENCLLSWSQLRHDAPITENNIQGGGEVADETRHAGVTAATIPPQWWQARHNQQQQQPTRNLGTGAPQQRNSAHSVSSTQMEEHYVGSGWWTCYLPSLPPAVPLELFPRHLELQCGFGMPPNSGGGLHMEITSSIHTHLPCLNNTSTMAPPPPAPLFSCEIVYGLTKHDPSLYFQEGGGEGHDPTLPLPPQSWGSSPLALQWAIGFLVIVAFSFFFSMAYLIASPSYHRKLVSYRLAKKFDELEDWVAKKEDALHHGAEGGSRQHEIASSEASSQGQSKGHRRMQRLAAHGLLLEKVDQDAERRNRINEAHDSSSPLRGSKQQQAAFSSSAVMYHNPAKRTLGELLEDSRRETHQPPMHHRNRAAAAQHSFESAPNFSTIGAVHSSSSSSSMSQQDRHYWDDHSSSNSGLRQRPPASNHRDHHHQRHHVSTVSPVVSAAQVDSFPIDGAWVD